MRIIALIAVSTLIAIIITLIDHALYIPETNNTSNLLLLADSNNPEEADEAFF